MREQISVEAIIAAFDQTNAGPEPRLEHSVRTFLRIASWYRRRLQERPWSLFAIVLILQPIASDNDARSILPSFDLQLIAQLTRV